MKRPKILPDQRLKPDAETRTFHASELIVGIAAVPDETDSFGFSFREDLHHDGSIDPVEQEPLLTVEDVGASCDDMEGLIDALRAHPELRRELGL